MSLFEKVVLLVAVAASLVASAWAYRCREAVAEAESYWSQFRCEGDCEEGSGCPSCGVR